MQQFDFKSYHLRTMKAESEEEKKIINLELKEFYNSLNEDNKHRFNEQLEKFLIKEYSAIKSVVDGVKPEQNIN